ncbi:MAG: hypothetical protein Q8O13_04785 [Candidatus Omnitrophota bacterium]|nr:hypothetical protein [Candidatus Omnitrophota bacterium]
MENNLLENLNPELKKTLKIIGKKADASKIRAFVVGGFVRDILLKKDNLDLDIVVEASAINFARHLLKLILGKLTIHNKFNTATLVSQKFRIDFTTARRETYAHPSALPDIYPGTIRDDLFRRDFTINAMAISLNQSSFGKLMDFFGGQKDLSQKKIRILHELSFADDPTRILRAIRFKERFNFVIEKRTAYLMKQALKSKALLLVKPPRIFDELIHILKEEKPAKYILSIKRICGFEFIDPRIKLDSFIIKLLKEAERQISWFQVDFAKKRKLDSWLIYFMILLNKVNIKTVYKIIHRFNLKRGDTKRIISCKNITNTERILNKKILKLSEIFKVLEPLSYEVILLIKIKSNSPLVRKRIITFFKILNGLKLATNGEDLKRLGLKQGKSLGLLLERLLHKKIDGLLKTKQAELSLIKQLIAK